MLFIMFEIGSSTRYFILFHEKARRKAPGEPKTRVNYLKLNALLRSLTIKFSLTFSESSSSKPFKLVTNLFTIPSN